MTGKVSKRASAHAAASEHWESDRDGQLSVLSKAGERIDTSGEIWLLAAAKRINWARMPLAKGPVLHATQEHVRNLIRTGSADYVYAQFQNLRRLFAAGKSAEFSIDVPETYDETFFVKIKQALSDVLKRRPAAGTRKARDADGGRKTAKPKNSRKAFSKGTIANTLDAYRRWFVFCADEEYEGFDQELATVLENQVIGGNPKGRAVLSDDPNEGPLRHVETLALQVRLLAEMQTPPDSLDELLVTWTCMSFGIYPKAMQYLNEEDLIRTDLPDGGVRYELRIPRLKKRGVNPRDEFHVRPVDPRIGKLFEQKKLENQAIWKYAFMGRDSRHMQRPMFPASSRDLSLVGTPFEVHALRSTKAWFAKQLELFVERAAIQAEDGSPLRVTARRLRYTFATRLVKEGASPTELAQALDHSDLQHVMVYFNNRSDMVVSLDKAFALRLAPVAQIFMGVVIKNETEALRGDDPASRIHFADSTEQKKKLRTVGSCGSFGFCGLHAHIACYTCFKFQPWLEGPHEKVLEELLREREDLLNRGADLKIVEANDLPILAVAQVVRRCQEIIQYESQTQA
ncbi:Phage integrase [Paraburkholderia kururiensis]|uniref:tyrosine-type recombinase/integrase n=1 Tax=Paraburkholderia kururiensis TaxID=984307 RepID=UPI0039A548A2